MGNRNSAALPYLTWDNQSQDPNQPYADDEPLNDEQLAKSKSSIGKNHSIDLNNIVKLSLRLKKKVIQSSSFNAQQFPMLATLNVDNIKSSSKAPLDLVCVIDHSGSMSGKKIELVKKSFKYLLKYLGDSDRLSIVIFDDTASRLVPLVKTTKANKKKILASLSRVHGRGGTDINLGMEIAFNILKQRRQSNPVTSIFLLSDGLDGSAQHSVRATLERIKLPEEITINTFGFGQDHDPQLMGDIAGLRDGNFYFIKELNTVDEAFIDCLGGLLSSVAQSAEIRIQAVEANALPGVEIVKAYGDENMWITHPQVNGTKRVYTTKLNNLISGRQKNFVLEVSIPINKNELLDHQKDIQIVKAEAEIVGLNGEKVIKTTFLHITLLNENEELKSKEEDDTEVMKNFYRVKGASLIDDGRKLADQGRNDEAKKGLEGFKEELEHCFLKNEEFIKNMIKDIERAIENVNPVVYQQFGKIEMMSECKAQMYEKSNLKSANCYQNIVQTEMLKEVRSMKKKLW